MPRLPAASPPCRARAPRPPVAWPGPKPLPSSHLPNRVRLPLAAVVCLLAAVLGALPPSQASNPPAETGTNLWWAFRPLTVPSATRATAQHPVDALAGVDPASAPPADRRTLLRRLMVDLHGLLPTPDEVEAFEQDPRPDAFERQVDRLLASPRYGERWARHWLDVVRFAETHGHDQDRPRDHAWPYRDYVIEAFNSDLPFPRFLEEQIAADALYPDEPRRWPALGFLSAGPWDESSLRDIREDTVDREVGRYLDRDDIVSTVMTTFASVTAHCARCHDHKFDPIPQSDYYALQAVFAGTEKAERLYDEDPATNRARLYWMRLQIALDRRDGEILESLLTPELRAEQARWEKALLEIPVTWQPLAATEISASSPVEFHPGPDRSVRVAGSNPATNTYTIVAPVPGGMGALTAVRLEVLPDDTLPAKGPGRAANGNLHLTGFSLETRADDAAFRRVELAQPSASHNQEGWDIARALDADPATGWGIHPREGEAHTAVFELAGSPPDPSSPRQLRFTLAQDHGRQHTLGRFRLSVTDAPRPVRATPHPDTLLATLRRTASERTPAEHLEAATAFLAGRPARELARLPEPRRVYAGASVFPANGGQKPLTRPRPVHVLRRGEIGRPGTQAQPGALRCLPAFEPTGTSRITTGAQAGPVTPDPAVPEEARRRAALAQWLSHPDNPLAWRSIVNRVWQHHFGRGIVETPNDFGRMGALPSSPPLLDGLALLLRDDLGGSLKSLHRLILTSAAWKQRALPPSAAAPLQPRIRRLDAETFRDSLLRFSGRLDDRMGGPSVRLFAMSPGIHVTPNVDYAAFDADGPGSYRRSIYRFLFRTLPDPLMDTLDCPAGDQSAPVRGESFTALQAFALLHHPFVVRQSAHLAADIAARHREHESQVVEVCRRLWLRAPVPDEHAALVSHLREHGLPHLCRVLLNSNELHFVD